MSYSNSLGRLDLEYALEMGLSTLFNMEDIVHDTVSAIRLGECLRTEYSHKAPRFAHFETVDSKLRNIALDMTYLSWLYNDAIAGERPKLDMVETCIALWQLSYRLLHFRPLSESKRPEGVEDVVSLGLIMFILPFLHKLDGRVPYCALIHDLAHSATNCVLDTEGNKVLLWMLLAGTASVYSYPFEEHIVSAASRVIDSLCINTWEEVASMLTGFPWVDALFGRSGQLLFDAAAGVTDAV